MKLSSDPRLNWLDGTRVRPYVFVRDDARLKQAPGEAFKLDWFNFDVIYKNPLKMEAGEFADQILNLEHRAFGRSGMTMPRWVFYDCALLPGFVAGFAIRGREASPAILKALEIESPNEWVPISLFIIIPTMVKGEWVAHNLCTVNSLVAEADRFYGLGFLTKAYGLWHANIEVCGGVTQWQSPAVKLHSHYGAFEVLTAYTPVHDYARTITYRLAVDPQYWSLFFNQKASPDFSEKFKPAGFEVDPKDDQSLIQFQKKIEERKQRFFLDSQQIRTQALDAPLKVYSPL
jgi:hypothetical protein